MSKEWEYQHEGDTLTVYASSRAEALSRVRDKLGRRRLPNGSKVLKCEQNKTVPKWLPPFKIEVNRTFMWNTEAIHCLPDVEAAKEAGDWDTVYLVRDSAGKLATTKPTEDEAEAWIAQQDG